MALYPSFPWRCISHCQGINSLPQSKISLFHGASRLNQYLFLLVLDKTDSYIHLRNQCELDAGVKPLHRKYNNPISFCSWQKFCDIKLISTYNNYDLEAMMSIILLTSMIYIYIYILSTSKDTNDDRYMHPVNITGRKKIINVRPR